MHVAALPWSPMSGQSGRFMAYQSCSTATLCTQDVLTAIDLSKKTFRRIWINYFWTFCYNCLMMPLAAGALYAPLQWQVPPWAAGAAMALSSVSVVCSSLLLRRYKKPQSVLKEVHSFPRVDMRWSSHLLT